jgi:uncharacterized protein YdeI (YjbR/CyaY-like superfamily)
MRKKPPKEVQHKEFQHVQVRSQTDLRTWLKANCDSKESIWLVTFKKPSPFYLPYPSIVEEALCFGWIDSLPRALDEKRTMIRLSPRNPKSSWSKINRDRAEKLIRQKRMASPGLKIINEAKRNGAWDRLKAVDGAQLPRDLASALKKNPLARRNFEAFPPSTKRAILEWIQQAKTSATREKRVSTTVELAAKDIRANQYRQPKGVKVSN